jgi:NAD(P)-dependent dehydrogenase (short-subunit alcohol dehydrogenase family)
MKAVVTGANRGIGLEFVKQLLARGASVDAGVRDPDRAVQLCEMEKNANGALRVHVCDVSDDASVHAFARNVGDAPVDLLVNNAGVYGGAHQGVSEMDFRDALATMNTNALGAVRVSLALLPVIRKSKTKKIVHITSGMGSIGDNSSGGFLAYRMSKAALNMASKTLAVDLRNDGVISVVINPGWVQTDMGGAGASTPVRDSVAGMLAQIDGVTLANSGAFLNWRGGEYVW